jgi:hypothetical protein
MEMKKFILSYRKLFDVPDKTSDAAVVAGLITFLILFFILGIGIGMLLPYFI